MYIGALQENLMAKMKFSQKNFSRDELYEFAVEKRQSRDIKTCVYGFYVAGLS
jgi:hypothetical protein